MERAVQTGAQSKKSAARGRGERRLTSVSSAPQEGARLGAGRAGSVWRAAAGECFPFNLPRRFPSSSSLARLRGHACFCEIFSHFPPPCPSRPPSFPRPLNRRAPPRLAPRRPSLAGRGRKPPGSDPGFDTLTLGSAGGRRERRAVLCLLAAAACRSLFLRGRAQARDPGLRHPADAWIHTLNRPRPTLHTTTPTGQKL